MHWRRGQRWLHEGARPSLLGEGLLDRARATSLALLGATAAVGLAIVALALNQGWPLIAGSSIPRVPPQREDVGAATVVAQSGHASPAGTGVRAGPSGHHAGGAIGPAPGAGAIAAPTGSDEIVVSPPAPAEPAPPTQGSPGPHRHANTPHQPAQHSPAPQSPPPAPASTPAPTVTTAGAPAPSAPPVATTSEAPVEEESNVPSWSHGKGHAYGRSEAESGSSEEDGGEGGHGHGHDRE